MCFVQATTDKSEISQKITDVAKIELLSICPANQKSGMELVVFSSPCPFFCNHRIGPCSKHQNNTPWYPGQVRGSSRREIWVGHTWICGGGALFGQVGIFGNPRLSNSQNLKQFRCFTGFLLFFPFDWMYLGYFKRGSEVFDKIPPPNKK